MATNKSKKIRIQRLNSDYLEDSGNRNHGLGISTSLSQTGVVYSNVAAAESDASSTSDVNPSELCFYDTPYTTDINISDVDSDVANTESNWNDTSVLNGNYSQPLFDDKCEDVLSNATGVPVVSSTDKSSDQANYGTCAVLLCTENFRKLFNTLFFVRFPKNNLPLCEVWWKHCRRSGEFDPSSNICSIHFNITDFKLSAEIQNNQLYLFHQIAVNTFNTVPTKFLLPDEFAMFANKQRNMNDGNQKKSEIKIKKCSVQNCNKTKLNSKNTLFFRYPLQNKHWLKMWLVNINLSNWQPSETDEICSDHFENHDIKKMNDNNYKLEKFAYPSIKPMKPFVMNSEDFNQMPLKFKFNSTVSTKNYVGKISQLQNVSTTNQLGSTEMKSYEDKQLLNYPDKLNDSNVECCATDNILDRASISEELQTTNNDTERPLKQYLELFESQNSKEEKYENGNLNSRSRFECVYLNVSSDSRRTVKTQPKIDANDDVPGKQKNRVKYPPIRIINVEKNRSVVLRKSCTIVGALPTPATLEPSRNFPSIKTTKTNKNEGIPKSVIYTKELTNSYGEMLLPSCETGCESLCYYAVPGPQRRRIFKEFQMLNNVTEQNCQIVQQIQWHMVTKVEDNTIERRPSFHLTIEDSAVKVCRLFFSNTLGITKCRLDAILKPINYNWYSDRETALKANHLPAVGQIINEPMTDFMKESMKPLNQDYNLCEPESDSEVSLDNVSPEEYQKALLFIKKIPCVLNTYKANSNSEGVRFETTVCFDHIYKTYSENYIQSGIPPPYTKRQFKKIYNNYRKLIVKNV